MQRKESFSHADGLTPVSGQECFAFGCHPQVTCFNACCRDLNQFLAPYDIVQLKNLLGIRSEAFLATYTARHIGPQTGLPVITLRPKDGPERECPFVTPAGCRVYSHRPASCRIYPLARAVTRCRQTGRLTEHFALIRESHCLGYEQSHRQSVRKWLQSQQLQVYLKQNDRFLELIAWKNQMAAGPLDLRSQHLFQLALYDVDSFRDHILHKGLLNDWQLPAKTLERLRNDELTLLRLGHQFVARELFGRNPLLSRAHRQDPDPSDVVEK